MMSLNYKIRELESYAALTGSGSVGSILREKIHVRVVFASVNALGKMFLSRLDGAGLPDGTRELTIRSSYQFSPTV